VELREKDLRGFWTLLRTTFILSAAVQDVIRPLAMTAILRSDGLGLTGIGPDLAASKNKVATLEMLGTPTPA
jgi:hypothetical protein